MTWAVLSVGALVVFLPSVGLLAGWVPTALARRPGPTRLLGAAGVLLYTAVIAGALPRLVGAPAGVRSGLSRAAVGLVILAILLGIVYDLKRGPMPGSRK
ncbi:hypothetical protein ABZ837_14475 [Streptomyces sp. NPDC047197]|uniref:hypothetical protein n=1 Tax=Streptomyces sp. NPDC047197 TaxID=3155477 RepID=UPI0033CF21FD